MAVLADVGNGTVEIEVVADGDDYETAAARARASMRPYTTSQETGRSSSQNGTPSWSTPKHTGQSCFDLYWRARMTAS